MDVSFNSEIRNFENLLTPLVLDTDAFEWVGQKISQNKGREGWLDLVIRYNGSTKSERRIYASRYKLSDLFYKNEIILNRDTLSTKIKAVVDNMENYGEG